jgi:hypothetical protein
MSSSAVARMPDTLAICSSCCTALAEAGAEARASKRLLAMSSASFCTLSV